VFVGKHEGRDKRSLGGLFVDWRRILKWISQKCDVKVRKKIDLVQDFVHAVMNVWVS
jgi:hypothetical protein